MCSARAPSRSEEKSLKAHIFLKLFVLFRVFKRYKDDALVIKLRVGKGSARFDLMRHLVESRRGKRKFSRGGSLPAGRQVLKPQGFKEQLCCNALVAQWIEQ